MLIQNCSSILSIRLYLHTYMSNDNFNIRENAEKSCGEKKCAPRKS